MPIAAVLSLNTLHVLHDPEALEVCILVKFRNRCGDIYKITQMGGRVCIMSTHLKPGERSRTSHSSSRNAWLIC